MVGWLPLGGGGGRGWGGRLLSDTATPASAPARRETAGPRAAAGGRTAKPAADWPDETNRGTFTSRAHFKRMKQPGKPNECPRRAYVYSFPKSNIVPNFLRSFEGCGRRLMQIAPQLNERFIEIKLPLSSFGASCSDSSFHVKLKNTLELMYPVSIGVPGAVKFALALIVNRHSAEPLITSVFALEKTLRRSLRCYAVRR